MHVQLWSRGMSRCQCHQNEVFWSFEKVVSENWNWNFRQVTHFPVTCRRCSILSFLHHSRATWKCHILMQTPLESDIWLQSYEQFKEAENNIKQKNSNWFLADISETVFATLDSFPLIMSHMCLKNFYRNNIVTILRNGFCELMVSVLMSQSSFHLNI